MTDPLSAVAAPSSSFDALRASLAAEARQAPKLFADLARIESYIAESYKTRALIELLQNADDAGASAFAASYSGRRLIAANNGREFTAADVEALCRSGASNKQRGGASIGYRGIGFKSVVNLASRVYVLSGATHFTFDRDRTAALVATDEAVPLIRIPHEVAAPDAATVELLQPWRDRFTTVFCFEAVDPRLVAEEFELFDSGTILFLRHITDLTLREENGERLFTRSCQTVGQRQLAKLGPSPDDPEWEILSTPGDPVPRLALCHNEGKIVPAPNEQSVIHSFTPTSEYAGAALKINGDFTTDPSRKTVDLDAASEGEFLKSCQTLAGAITAAIERKAERPGLFSVLAPTPTGEGRFRAILWHTLTAIFAEAPVRLGCGTVPLGSVKRRPEWLNYTDFEVICRGRWSYVDRQLIVDYPQLELFLTNIGALRLKLTDILGCPTEIEALSDRGRIELLARCATEFRFDLDQAKIGMLSRCPLLRTADGFKTASKLHEVAHIEQSFLSEVSSLTDPSDLAYLLGRLGLRAPQTAPQTASAATPATTPSLANRAPAAIAKWRSAEHNALEYLKSLDSVISVVDVSQANLGHDLEVTLRSGKRFLVEVKSVSSFAEAFSLTNNEYAAGSTSRSDYVLAIVINGDRFEIGFIGDPVRALQFERRCERWSWHCTSYSASLRGAQDLFA